MSIAQLAAGGVGGAQGLLILAVVDEQEGAGAAFLQQMDRRAARFDRAEQLMLKDISEKEQATARKILAKMTENLRREVGGDVID